MSKRPLTSGEIRLAQDLFADAIQYSAVRVYDRGFAFLNAIGDMSYAGHLYFPTRYREDFSQTALPEQRLFIHELVHVWQYQHNVLNLALAALREGDPATGPRGGSDRVGAVFALLAVGGFAGAVLCG